MPNLKKYTIKQREKISEMYAMSRSERSPGEYSKGRFTLKQISLATGVPIVSVFYIANGER